MDDEGENYPDPEEPPAKRLYSEIIDQYVSTDDVVKPDRTN